MEPDPPRTDAPPYSQLVAPAARRSRTLPIVVGGVVVAAAIAGVLTMQRGEPIGSSRDAVIRDTVAALAAGDADRLIRLTDTRNLAAAIADCTAAKDQSDENRSPDALGEAMVSDVRRAAQAYRGAALEVVEIRTKLPPPLDSNAPGDPELAVQTMRKGQLSNGCTVKTTFRIQLVDTSVAVSEAGKPEKQDVSFEIVELAGRYYLGSLPQLKVHAAALAQLDDLRDEMCSCSDARCAVRVDRVYQRDNGIVSGDVLAQLTSDELSRLAPLEGEYKVCRTKARAMGSPGDVALGQLADIADEACSCRDGECLIRATDKLKKRLEALRQQPLSTLPDADALQHLTDRAFGCAKPFTTPVPDPDSFARTAPPAGIAESCVAYHNDLVKAVACDKYPDTTRVAFEQQWITIAEHWKSAPEEHAALDDECKSGHLALGRNALCP